MLKKLRSRRHDPRYTISLIVAVVLLVSVTVLYIRLTTVRHHRHSSDPTFNPLLEEFDLIDRTISEEKIDILDDTLQDPQQDQQTDDIDIDIDNNDESNDGKLTKYYFDHLQGVIRRVFDKKSIDQWEDYAAFDYLSSSSSDLSNVGNLGFGSDDVVLNDNVRNKLAGVVGVEDALLLRRGSGLRQGWGEWFEKKSDFLRRDRMFKSNLELLNPLNNPFLQDPDGGGVTLLTKGDKLIQKRIVREFKSVPFVVKKRLSVSVSVSDAAHDPVSKGKVESEVKIAERKTLDDNVGSRDEREMVVDKSGDEMKWEFSGQIFADGKRWGYFPGLHPRLSFSNFMDAFFRKGKCSMRVFMVWNSPPWMFSVRHQRGLESLLFHHRDACVVVFSETIELNFFDGFVKDGFKVAVVMPNLDELLKDTPTHEFASVWFEWRKTKFYPTHYSELIRLAALYKYGGIYLDSDVIVTKPLHSLSNMVGVEDESSATHLNGAVMAFRKHSPFIMECLMEFYASYDDTNVRWNGADLLTRVGSMFLHEKNGLKNQMELKLQPFFAFFPISRENITRYFTPPTTESEKADQDALFQKIIDESLAFHFWNSLTSGIVPEPESLVARLIDHHCIRCSDML